MQRIDEKQAEIMMVDWVNCLDIPSCSLVDGLKDLRSGCVVADILSWVKDCQIPGIHRKVQNHAQEIENWTAIVNELPENSLELYPEELLEVSDKQDDQRILELLQFLSDLKVETRTDGRNTSATKATESSMGPKRSLLSPVIQKKFIQETPQKPPERSSYEAKPVNESLKEDLIIWLEDLNILRKNTVDSQMLPSICRTGVLFCDLINRLEGRSEVIKGIERNPKNRTHSLANINKVIEFLRKMPKMSSKHLFSAKEVIDGNEFVVWGLIEDINTLYTVSAKSRTSSSFRLSKPVSSSSRILDQPDNEIALPPQFLHEKSKALRSYSASMKRTPSQTPSTISPRISRPPSSASVKPPVASHFYISEDIKQTALAWVQALGIEHFPSANLYTDSLKNGTLLCELLRILENEPINMNVAPRSSKAIIENYERAISVFKKKHANFRETLISSPASMADNPDLVLGFINSLISIYPKTVPSAYKEHPLPYGALGIRKLEQSITHWIAGLNILQPSPDEFSELIPEFKSGVLLCIIVSRVFYMKIPSINREPKSEQAAMNNLCKALDILKKLPGMSKKFVWLGKEIIKGNQGILLGLLEDIHRCADGLPARKTGENYHKDGPYLGVNKRFRTSSVKAIKEEPLDATFGSWQSLKNDEKEEEGDYFTEWIKELGIKLPFGIDFMQDRIPEFSSGVILCSLVGALERASLTGVDKEPRFKNAAMKNIIKALTVLKSKSKFPSELKNCEEELFKGSGAVIRKLLQSLMKMYKT